MKEHSFNKSKRDFIRKCAALSAGFVIGPDKLGFSEYTGNMKDPYRRLAMFQEETPRGTICLICPNECVLKEGELSQCNNRIVYKSKLYTMAYGNPCSVNIDPVEKKPLYHFYPGTTAFSIATAGCNLACLNCQNWTISQTTPQKTTNIELPPEQVVEECLKSRSKSIAYTYSEPVTFYEYAFETATIARSRGVKNVFKSNGYINPEPLRKMCGVLDAANIDLKAMSESTYLKLSGGKLQPVLDSLKIYRDEGVWLEITNLIVPNWTDNKDEIRKMCKWLYQNGFSETPIHFSRFYPVYKLQQVPPTPLEILNTAASIAADEGLNYIYVGNVPGNDMADTKCPSCGKTLISRQGFRVVSNKVENGNCYSCGKKVAGVWE